jgi:hypothetical protein
LTGSSGRVPGCAYPGAAGRRGNYPKGRGQTPVPLARRALITTRYAKSLGKTRTGGCSAHMPDDQQYGYDQGQYQAAQGQDQSQAQHGGGGHEDEDVEIDWEYTAEEGLQCSMSDLTSVGYEPPADDDSSHIVA